MAGSMDRVAEVVEACDAVGALWVGAGGDPAALDGLTLAGAEPALPSSFRIGTAAQASIAAAALAAAEVRAAATGRRPAVAIDVRHAAAEFRSEQYLRIIGSKPPSVWDPLAGLYRTADGHVRLHTNFTHHRDAVVRLLGCDPTRDAVQAALLDHDAVGFETAANEAGAVVAALRSHQDWLAHPQGRAVAGLPPVVIEKIGEAPPRPLPSAGLTALAGLRVLDLSRIIAGPVAGRVLAAHGATVMRIGAPNLPVIDWLVIDTGRGKLSAHADLATEGGRAALAGLLGDADILIQAYRPGALAARGFGPEQAARLRPGIVYASLSAYGDVGPWAGRRGFDSLVQTASGFNDDEGRAAGGGPRAFPCQALDHASGCLLAFGALMARLRQAAEGGSWSVGVSLAGTGHWLRRLGWLPDGLAAPDPGLDAVADLLEVTPSPFGTLRAVRHAAWVEGVPAGWALPPVPLGTHPARWP